MPEENTTAAEVGTEETTTKNDKGILRHTKLFAVIVIFILIITVIVASVSETKEANELAAWNKIFTATFAAQTSEKDLSTEINSALKDGAKNTDAAFYAQVLILSNSGLSYDKAKLQIAKDAGAAFIAQYPENPFISQVRLDYATVLFNLEDYAGALENYDAILQSKANYMADEVNLFKALTLEKLGKDTEAIKTYTYITSEDNNFSNNIKEYAAFAKSQLEQKSN